MICYAGVACFLSKSTDRSNNSYFAVKNSKQAPIAPSLPIVTSVTSAMSAIDEITCVIYLNLTHIL